MKVAKILIFTVFAFFIVSCKSSKIKVESSVTDDAIFFSEVDIKPLFNGKDAEASFREYVVQNLRYPIEAMEKKITGQVEVEFIITKDGSIDRIKVVRSAHRLLDAELVRVIKSSSKWSPGIQNGEVVNVKFLFNTVFRM